MSTQTQKTSDEYIFRGANRRTGRHVAVSPGNSPMRHLVYARIRLDADVPPPPFGVPVPGHANSFVWLMAAHREREGRQFGVVTVQPGFDEAGSGLEASRS